LNPDTAAAVGSSAIPKSEVANITMAATNASDLDFDSRRSIS
jgi:hypothetical protein